ncbi:MAG: 50S ribosomal protein L9 [Acidobacteria bacterium]|nr:50S ribosomal protein L9 [Acidobacteriota bacterium]
MEVLLREDLEHLGDRGQIVRVRRGYGRNYLLPRGLAVEASAGNVRQIEDERRVLAKREARERGAAEEASKNLVGLSLSFERRAGEEGRLFGSVTLLDIVHALDAAGHKVDRHRIRMKDTIKTTGEHEVSLRLHRDVQVPIKIVVTAEGGDEVATPAEAAPVIPGFDPVAPGEGADAHDDEYEDYDE